MINRYLSKYQNQNPEQIDKLRTAGEQNSKKMEAEAGTEMGKENTKKSQERKTSQGMECLLLTYLLYLAYLTLPHLTMDINKRAINSFNSGFQ